jgi:hypothetical protein
MVPEPLANSSLYARPDDRRPDATARRDSEPRIIARVRVPTRCGQQHEGRRIAADTLTGYPQEVAALVDAIAAPKATIRALGHLPEVETASCLRPLARRRFRTARPAWVFIRARNPCVRRLRIRLG